MNEDLIMYVVYSVFIFILIVVFYAFYRERKRDKDMKKFILINGFTFEKIEDVAYFLEGGVRDEFLGKRIYFSIPLEIFNTGYAKTIKNSFSIVFNNSKIYFFDYNYTVGGGKSSRTYSLTVAVFKSPNNIPQFYMRPEGFLDKIPEVFGYNDIDFAHREIFSKKYYLKSNDEIGIRSLFNDYVLEFFETHPGYYIESNNGYIAIYKYTYINPDKYHQFIDDVKNIISLFLESHQK